MLKQTGKTKARLELQLTLKTVNYLSDDLKKYTAIKT